MLITAVITPAVLISAGALLILGAVNRYARVIDKIYLLNKALVETDDARFLEELRDERHLFLLRARRTRAALMFLHGGVLCFVLESLLLGLHQAVHWDHLVPIQNGVVLVGILLFGGASAALLSEASIAFETTRHAIRLTDAKLAERKRT
jgi:hypothetical protein